MPRAPAVKRYSLFQRSVRVVQTSIRRADRWLAVRVPGLPNPPEIEEKQRKPHFVDLRPSPHLPRGLAGVQGVIRWSDEEELEQSKEEVKRAVQAVRGQVSSTASKNLSFIDKSLEGTKAHNNLHTLGEQGAENVKFLTKEIKHVAEGVDTDAVVSHAKQVVDDSRSKDDVATTLKKNVNELRHLAKEGRDAALNLEKKDVETFKTSAQSWFADKLLVGQSVLMAFIEGYREGKQLEMEREDALLITFAKQAAEDHKDIIENQIKKIMDQQREQQRQEQEAAQKAGGSENEVPGQKTPTKPSSGTPSASVQDKSTSAVGTEQQGDKPITIDEEAKHR
ncbi:hypothetical protein AM588_10008076 [Phytophthora nicotianae]|uniref:Uncharacterized protein n=1 Tax=Phytophthora nicotianae TaxID=4792 RepID=A0A0W8DL88_PHYNI|nr:hypothetical protein AM588_10008076 [Phytophthora nicotianae]